ncbi:hypothetical protein WJX82_009317 [Trebouxia sp. C0006]
MAELRQRKSAPDKSKVPSIRTSVEADGRARTRRQRKEDSPLLLLAAPLIVLFHVALVAFSVNRIYSTPPVLPENASLDLFSEARALSTVKDLTETIGYRLVSTKGVDEAHQYMLQQTRQLAAQAKKRGGINAEVEEQRVSGGVNLEYFHAPIGSLYQGLGNVMLRLEPTGQQAVGNTTVLLNAHYDSTLGSPGAADCASCVAVLLEIARVLVSDPTIQLPSPILFLFNGGEESLMQAAHGFVHSGHRWVNDIGVFINLEATGSGGPDTLFQHTAGWTAQTYAAAAKYPRGSVFLQDVFEAGFIPSDTDYRMFSAATGQLGQWPGLDIAHILDSASYHTKQDNLQRLRPGILQAMGENTLAAMLALSQRLASGPVPSLTPSRAKSVFFDVAGYFMVTYPMAVATMIHLAPLVLIMLVLTTMTKGTGQTLSKLLPIGKQAGLSVASFLCAVTIPAVTGALRSGLSGNPMAYYSSPPLQYTIYLPIALAATALPYALFHSAPQAHLKEGQRPLQTALLGFALVISAVAGLAVALGMGSGYLFAAWGVCAIVAAGFVSVVQQPLIALLGSMVLALPAQLLCLPLSLSLLIHCVGKANMAGAAPVAQTLVLDAVSGALIGAFTWWNLGFVAPALAFVFKRKLPAVLAALSLFCFITCVLASCAPTAYSDTMPKRVVLQHHNRHDAAGTILATRWTVAAVDSVPIDRALKNINLTSLPPMDNPWQTFFPLGAILQTVQFEAPPPQVPHKGPLTTVKVTKETTRGSVRHLEVEMQLPAAGWGVMNITSAGLKAWSFTETVTFAAQPVYPKSETMQHMLRFACNQGYDKWNFWLEVDVNQPEVWLDVAASLLEPSDAIKEFVSQLPSWASEVPATTYQSSWKL